MGTFIPGDMLCNYGYLVSRIEEIERGLKTRYACSKSGQYRYWKHSKRVERWRITLGLLCAWLWDLSRAYCSGTVLGYEGCGIRSNG